MTEDWADIYIDYMFAFHIRYIYVKNLPHTLIIGALAPPAQAGMIRFNARYALDKTIWFSVFWFLNSDLLEVKEGGIIT